MLAYVEVEAVARAAGISVRNMRKAVSKAFAGKPWRGCALEVRRFHSAGGRAGTVHRVALASLPEDVRALIPCPVQPDLPLIVVSGDDKSWKRRLVQSILTAGPEGSGARGAALRRVAASARYPSGKRAGQHISERALRSWIAAYDSKGSTALERARRADRGKARTVTWRALDQMMVEGGVPADRLDALKEKIVREVKTLLASGAGTVSNVNMLAQPDLRDIVLAELPGMTREQLDKVCRIPAGFVRRYYRARLAHQKRTDAKGFADNVTPRVKRHRSDLAPMQVVAMDVRHSDAMYRRQDRSLATAKMIVAEDLANNRIFCRVFLMQKGEMIRREHVLMFMRDMFSDASWGVPQSIYLDNGGEFKTGDAADELCAVANFVRDSRSIEIGIFDEQQLVKSGLIRALPYNGQSKVIEGVFSNFTRSIERMYPGFVGGNRMAKKVENQGKEKKPMPGDEAVILTRYAEMIAYYNAKPQQKGHIAGSSPNDAFAKHVRDGWKSVVFCPQEFALAFGKNEHRQVQTGGSFLFKGTTYRHDNLLSMVGQRVLIRVPILDAGPRIPVLDDKGNVKCVAKPETTYGMRDLAGARERGRRTGVLNRQIAAEIDGVTVVPLGPRIARAVAELPAPPVPMQLATISVSPVIREATMQPQQPQAEQPQKLSVLARRGRYAASQNEKLRHAG